MNFFAYWTGQITPYAEKLSPIFNIVLMVSFVAFWGIVILRKAPESGSVNTTDWSKIPLSIIMLTYTFQWAFIPEFGKILGNVLVCIFIFSVSSWLIEYYKTSIVDDEDSEQQNSAEGS